MEKDEEDEKKLLSQEEQTEKELGDLKRRQEAIMKEMDGGNRDRVGRGWCTEFPSKFSS